MPLPLEVRPPVLEEGEEVSPPVRPLLEEPEELPEPDVPEVPEVPEVPDEPDEPDEPEEPDEEPPDEPPRPPPPLRFSSEMRAGVDESEESRRASGSASSIRPGASTARFDIDDATSPSESYTGAAPVSVVHVMSAKGAKNEDSLIAV